MTIIKMELIEGEELTYKNPYGVNIEVGIDPGALRGKYGSTGLVLKPDETLSIRTNIMYIHIPRGKR